MTRLTPLHRPVVSLVCVVWLLAACTPAPTPTPTLPSGPLGDLPPALAGLPRAEVNQGESVFRESRRFYQTDAAFQEGVVAHYRKGDGLATLWIARAETPEAAGDVVEGFLGPVQAGDTLYTLAETRTVNGVIVYVLKGQERVQYLFAAGDRVVLLDVFPRWAEGALRDLLPALP